MVDNLASAILPRIAGKASVLNLRYLEYLQHCCQ